jgi:hypothetical protein
MATAARALAWHVIGFVLVEQDLGQAPWITERGSLDALFDISAAALASQLVPLTDDR